MGIKVLFICKLRSIYGGDSYGSYGSFGLRNSARFVSEALSKLGIENKVVEVIDNNCINKEVHDYRPTHVIIEALWVVPEKFPILIKLHPSVHWYVRIHSEIPFLSNEGVAIQWIKSYADLMKQYDKFHISGNSRAFVDDIMNAMGIQCVYQPNIYEVSVSLVDFVKSGFKKYEKDTLEIGCFGAIRPLKNFLTQAFAAIIFADKVGKKIRFHINSGRVEQRGEPVLRNLQNLFPINGHELVEHPWLPHDEFLNVVKSMDLGMQVSLSESFNIVAADFVSQNIPIVVSNEIPWMPFWTQVRPGLVKSIVNRLLLIYKTSTYSVGSLNLFHLHLHNKKSKQSWLESLGVA